MGTNAGLTYSMFKPIMMVNSACSAITVNAKDDRFNTIEDFINYAKENEVSMGNSGNGAIWHLAAAGLAKETGAKFKHVAYDGAAGAITDLSRYRELHCNRLLYMSEHPGSCQDAYHS